MSCLEGIKNSSFCAGLSAWGKLYLKGPEDGLLEDRDIFEVCGTEVSGIVLTVASIAFVIIGILILSGVIPESYVIASGSIISPSVVGYLYIVAGILGMGLFGSSSSLGYCQGICGIKEGILKT